MRTVLMWTNNKSIALVQIWIFDFWCFNATFSNISAIYHGDQF